MTSFWKLVFVPKIKMSQCSLSTIASPILSTIRTDITTLKVEAIVNASNESGLGCPYPKDHCIDAAIHAAAGPKLLEACQEFKGIPTGTCKMTPGFDLPSQWVLHVTGPRKCPTTGNLDFRMLRHCYNTCLEVATKHGIKELAFCCLSTGLFGFPKKESAELAMGTVKDWLYSHPSSSLEKIVFVTWTYEDTAIYEQLLANENLLAK